MPIRLRPLLKPSYTLKICLDCTYNAWSDAFTWIRAAESLRYTCIALGGGSRAFPNIIFYSKPGAENFLGTSTHFRAKSLPCLPCFRDHPGPSNRPVQLTFPLSWFFLYTRAYSSPGKCKKSVRGRVIVWGTRYT